MSVVTRKFSAAPVRTAASTWHAMVDMLASSNGNIRSELMKIEGIVASIISEGTLASSAITIIGAGPRLRIYCLYEEDGNTEDANESSLSWNLFEREWEIHLPVEPSDLAWVKKSLAGNGSRFKAYEAGTKIQEEDDDSQNGNVDAEKGLTINTSKL